MPKIVGKLAAGDADGILMQAKALLDSNFNKNQEELNQKFASGSTTPLTQSEFNALATKEYKMYFIWNSQHELQRIYFHTTLIAKRGEVASNIGFPLVFPIIFN